MQNLSSTNLNYLNNILKKQSLGSEAQNEVNKEPKAEQPKTQEKDKIELSSAKKLSSNKPLLLVGALSVVSSLISIFAIHKSSNSQKMFKEGQIVLSGSMGDITGKIEALGSLVSSIQKKLDSSISSAASPSSKISANALSDTISKAVETAFLKHGATSASATLDEKQIEELKQLLTSKSDELTTSLSKNFTDISNSQNAILKTQIAQALSQTFSQALAQALSQAPNKGAKEKIDTVSLANEILKHIDTTNITQEIQKGLQTATNQAVETIQKSATDAIEAFTEKIQIQGEEVLAAVGDRVMYGVNKIQGEAIGKIDEISKSANESAQKAVEEISKGAGESTQKAIGEMAASAQGISLGLEQSTKGYIEKTNQALNEALEKAKSPTEPLETVISETVDKVETGEIRHLNNLKAGTSRINTSNLNPIKNKVTLSDIRFDKGRAYLKSGEAFSGYLEDQTKEGKKFMICFKDGEMISSNADGLQKIYDTHIKDGEITKIITTSKEGGVDNKFIYKRPQEQGEDFHMCARKYVIDGKNKLKREIMRFVLGKDGHYEKMQTKDGPYLKAVSTSGYSKDFSQEIQEYNRAMLQGNKFGEHIDTQIEGFTAFYPGNVEGFVVEGRIEKDETGKLRNIFLHSEPKGISSLAREKEKGLQVVKFDVQ